VLAGWRRLHQIMEAALDINDLPPEDRERLLHDIQAYGGDVHATQERQWIRDAYHYTKKVSEEGRETSAEARSVFWIRLLGVLDEVRDHIDGQVNFLGTPEAGPEEPQGSLLPSKRCCSQSNPFAGLSLRTSSYTSCIDVMWSVILGSTRIAYGWERRGSAKSGLFSDALGRSTMPDVALRKLLQRYGVDERAIAADFAARASRL
jgi:hypothetical protein